MTDKVQWALALADKGLAVFPLVHTLADGTCSCGDSECRPKNKGKHPKPGSHGYKDATKDKVEIFDAWDGDEDANIGVYPGTEYVWVDLDTKNEGVNGIESLADKLDIPPEEVHKLTFAVQTPTGGIHLYFRTPIPVSDRVNVLPGVDIRGSGGYVVGPGSTIAGREYRVINDVPIADIPDNLTQVLGRARERSADRASRFEWNLPGAIDRVRDLLKQRKPAIEGQGGDMHTLATIYHCRDHALDEDAIFELLTEPGGWNERCEPPWEADELRQKITNAFMYAKDPPGTKGGALMEMGDVIEPGEFVYVRSKHAVDPEDGEWFSTTDSDADEFADLRNAFHMGNDFAKLSRDFNFVIPNWIPAQGYTGILATRGIGKTTMIIDLVARLACDMDWYDVPTDRGWSVVYVVGEDVEGVQQRLLAWFKQYNNGEPFPDQSRFCVLEMPIDLTEPKDVKRFARFLDQFYKAKQEKEIEEEGEPRKTMFVFDTWQTATLRAERGMNDDAAMSLAAAHVIQLSKLFHGPSLIAFHPSKSNPHSVAGSSVVENMSTAIVKIEEDGDNVRTAVVTRLKGGKTGEYFKMKLDAVVLDGKTDQFGRPVTGAVIRKIGGSSMPDTPELKNDTVRVGRLIASVIENASAFKLNSTSTNAISNALAELPKFAAEGGNNSALYESLLKIVKENDLNISTADSVRKYIKRRFFDGRSEFDLEDSRFLIQEQKDNKQILRLEIRSKPLMERAFEEEEDILE
jgi:Bifunctional DNA primase/polymerase, N-terminal/AAA domain